MKILVTPTSFRKEENRAARERLEAFADEVVYNDLGRPLQSGEVLARLDGVDGYLAGLDCITAEVVERAPESLKVISRYGAGVDRVDLDACRARGITVTNTPGTNATAVCELAFCLMLCAARNVPALSEAVQRGQWPRSQGVELSGKTLGIVGLGAIGKKLALRARAFGMEVLAYDPCFDAAFAADNGVERSPLDEVLRRAHVISLHVPLTEETRHLIDGGRIAAMRDGAILVNTARGGLIDEEAAAQALVSGKLGGLGLDAFEVEPPTCSPLFGLDRAVFTPHTGAHTAEAVEAMGTMAVDDLIAVLIGAPCVHICS